MDGNRHLGKRSHSQYEPEASERNVKQKHRSSGGLDVVYRILCPGSRIGGVIGKGGNVIKSLRQETGARIKVADPCPGADERVIIISTSPTEKREAKLAQHHSDENAMDEDDRPLPPSQEALFKVLARMVEGDGSEEEEESVLARLLVPSTQIGCLIGKGGKIIEQMRTETGAQIRILPRDQLPSCAFDDDELVQISGELVLVKRALLTISTRLYENPARDRPSTGQLTLHEPSLLSSNPLLHHGAFFPQASPSLGPGQMAGRLIGVRPPLGTAWPYGQPMVPGLHGGACSKDESAEGTLVLRLLCPQDKIGSVIGKKGNVIQHIREETCAHIKIADPVPDADERIIIISANEALRDHISPALDAILQLQSRISDGNGEKESTTRILVPSANIGCLLGRKGAIITEMRRSTRATIRVLAKDCLPKCALEDDELVQIVGDFNVARDAVIEIVTRLRANMLRECSKVASNNITSLTPQTTSSSSFEGRQEPAAGFFSLSGLGTQGPRSSISTSPGAWSLQSAAGGLGALAYAGGSSQAGAMFTSMSGSGLLANIAGTTLEISIPSTEIGAIIGKGGCNIAQIRQISGAKVKLHDPQPGVDKRVIEISGAPEQTKIAQNLLSVFWTNPTL